MELSHVLHDLKVFCPLTKMEILKVKKYILVSAISVITLSACNPAKDSGGVIGSLVSNALASSVSPKARMVSHKTGDDYLNEAWPYINKNQYQKAEPLLIKSCNLNNAHSCNLLSVFYSQPIPIYQNKGIKKDEVRAAQLLDKSCRLNRGAACFQYASYYEEGIGGVKKNEAKKADVLAKSCKLGYQRACKYVPASRRMLDSAPPAMRGLTRDFIEGKDPFAYDPNLAKIMDNKRTIETGQSGSSSPATGSSGGSGNYIPGSGYYRPGLGQGYESQY